VDPIPAIGHLLDLSPFHPFCVPVSFTLRRATSADAPALCALINELAVYEKLADASAPNPEALAAHLAPDANPGCGAVLAEVDDTGVAVGFALFYPTYSTFLTNWGVHLEDLFVQPDYRGQGIGFALLERVVYIAADRGAERVEWMVLDWNTLALDFYNRLGAEPLNDWTTMRLSGEALQHLAGR